MSSLKQENVAQSCPAIFVQNNTYICSIRLRAESNVCASAIVLSYYILHHVMIVIVLLCCVLCCCVVLLFVCLFVHLFVVLFVCLFVCCSLFCSFVHLFEQTNKQARLKNSLHNLVKFLTIHSPQKQATHLFLLVSGLLLSSFLLFLFSPHNPAEASPTHSH